jgi:hypothetical protein
MLNVCAILCEMYCLCIMCYVLIWDNDIFDYVICLCIIQMCQHLYISMLVSGPMTVSVQRGTCHMCTDCGGPEIKS